ncbi:MAG TPA: hypothetical protein VMQ76_07740 [Terracidiphilus sp.]|jgi:hypothetical protein|nr:hypothetical protein [Terracidiphilus sp.]
MKTNEFDSDPGNEERREEPEGTDGSRLALTLLMLPAARLRPRTFKNAELSIRHESNAL